MNQDWHTNCFYRVSVKALIRDQAGNVLMVSEKGGDFSLPGGGWDYGESLEECLKRELREEVNIVSPFDERVITTLPFYNPNKQAWQLWVVCEVACPLTEIGVGEDADRVEWVNPNDIDYSTQAGKLIGQTLAVAEDI